MIHMERSVSGRLGHSLFNKMHAAGPRLIICSTAAFLLCLYGEQYFYEMDFSIFDSVDFDCVS